MSSNGDGRCVHANFGAKEGISELTRFIAARVCRQPALDGHQSLPAVLVSMLTAEQGRPVLEMADGYVDQLMSYGDFGTTMSDMYLSTGSG